MHTPLTLSVKCRLQTIVFTMQMSTWQEWYHCFLTLEAIVHSQSTVCILLCPPFNANPQKLIFTLFEGIVWHLWATFLSGTTAVMAMSLLQQLKCQLKYHKKYVLLQNNNGQIRSSVCLLVCSVIQKIKQSLVKSNFMIFIFILYFDSQGLGE